MASPGNPNQPGGGPFDVHKFFNPSPANPNTSQNPNSSSNLSSPSFPQPSVYPPPPSASYPPPSGPYSYPPQTSSPLYHHQFHIPPPYAPQPEHMPGNLLHQRSVPYSTPPLQPPNPNHGARLMALLSAPPPSTHEIPPQQAMPLQPPQNLNINPMLPSVPLHSAPLRMPSSKLPKGRHLVGDRVLYDVDVRLAGEVQPQLEVTPITKYASDPGLVLGRQIAVNKNYICYGLKMGAIRILNINTALRSLLKGLAQRVTDMAFFAEDVHLLAGASTDGRVFVWKITEGPDEDDKPQITGKIVVAIQISGEGKSLHPRVCWHCHKQEVLVVGVGNRILRIDTTKVGKGEVYSAEEPLDCPVEKLIDGVQFVGNHDGEVTDLSMCQWMTTRLVSASVDGMIKIWDDRKTSPIAVLKPHDGLPVNSVTFLTAPQRPDHIILITGGPLNREIKIWASESEEGWLLPSDSDSWHCTQTLELKSSAEPRGEEVFFNQVLALSHAGLVLLANAKKNAIYAVHMDYGPNPEATRMDYIAEFTVAMPILSFTGTSDLLPHGEQIVQVYCVQTQAIQQYALDLLQCLPPPMDNVVFDRSDSSVSRDGGSTEGFAGLESFGGKSFEMSIASSAPQPYESSSTSASALKHPLSSPSAEASTLKEYATPSMDLKPISSALANNTDIACVASPSVPLSPRLSRKLSDFGSPSSSQLSDYGGDQKIIEYSVDRRIDIAHRTLSDIPSLDDDSRSDENRAVKFKPPTHLVTPAEILAKPSSESSHASEHKSDGESDIQAVVVNSGTQNVEVDVKVVDESEFSQNADLGSQGKLHNFPSEQDEKSFYSQASDLGIEMARNVLPKDDYIVNESKQVDGASESKSVVQSSGYPEESHDTRNDITGQDVDSVIPATVESPAPSVKGKKRKGKNTQGSGPTSQSASAFNSTDSSNEPGASSSFPSAEAAFSQIQTMQEMLIQLTTMHKEMQKQITANVSVPVTKEGRRLETSLGKMMEKAVKANNDALWARLQEENAKQEKLLRERTQQMTGLITNFLNKDLPGILEKTVKKELAAVSPAIARTVTPVIEKSISTAITEAFQRGIGDKAVNQLEKSVSSKLEATVARQIQAQFQTSGKQVLQEAFKSSMETSVVPAFESSCKAMFDQVDATFQKGMAEHTTAAQQQFESMHSPLAIALRDTINSASSVTQTLNGELAEGQRKLVALAVAGTNSKALNPLVTQISNGSLGGFHEKIEAPLDPTKELSRLVYEHKYEEAFTTALQRSDVWIVSWLCSQVDLQGILSMNPLPLSQGVLLSLLQQLACDISKETPRKLAWMTDVVAAIKPTDQMIAMHVRPIYEQVFQILNHQLSLPTNTVAEISSIRVVLVIINSTLRTL